jgi:neutral ceramidase
VRSRNGASLGCLVNFACHPTDHGGGTALSAGYPGVLAKAMKSRGWPITLFLNGACGNISLGDPYHGRAVSMEAMGTALADHTSQIIAGLAWRERLKLGSDTTTLDLPFRAVTDDQVRGTVRGAQRFIDAKIYDRAMPALVETIRKRKVNKAEVQVLFMDELAWVAVPAEYFVQHGLRIKASVAPAHALVVSHANGMVGYVPTREAFERGGYETTFLGSSRLAPEAGDLLADAAIALVQKHTRGA